MEENRSKISESGTPGAEDKRLKRFIQKLMTYRADRSAGTLGCHRVLPPEADANVTARRVFLGSTLEFMQREYFSEPQPKKNQRDDI